jgi:hypothetical protein
LDGSSNPAKKIGLHAFAESFVCPSFSTYPKPVPNVMPRFSPPD